MYERLKALARKKEMSATELAEFLINQYSQPYTRAFIDEEAKGKKWQEIYEDIILDPKIECYQSTCWVRTPDYIRNVGPPYWTIDRRLRNPEDPFNVERMFIISKDSWGRKEVMEWLSYWAIVCFSARAKFRIFIIKEKDADRIVTDKNTGQVLSKYYDMGIYRSAPGKGSAWIFVGFLQIDEESRPVLPDPYKRYSSSDSPTIVKDAEKYFKDLKEHALAMESSKDFAKLQKQPYDE
jgi:hypothetical protein